MLSRRVILESASHHSIVFFYVWNSFVPKLEETWLKKMTMCKKNTQAATHIACHHIVIYHEEFFFLLSKTYSSISIVRRSTCRRCRLMVSKTAKPSWIAEHASSKNRYLCFVHLLLYRQNIIHSMVNNRWKRSIIFLCGWDWR